MDPVVVLEFIATTESSSLRPEIINYITERSLERAINYRVPASFAPVGCSPQPLMGGFEFDSYQKSLLPINYLRDCYYCESVHDSKGQTQATH